MPRTSITSLCAALLAGGALALAAGSADATPAAGPRFALAVYGDSPYGTTPTDTAEFAATPAFIDSINADPDVSTVVHVGDIHSGKQYCTEAYDRSIADAWTRFADPLVYTPGDNEWTDCHKPGEGGGRYNATTGAIDYVLDPATQQPVDYAAGDPVANLALVRQIFFARPGRTLGQHAMPVLSQAQLPDPAHPGDRAYVENVLWQRAGIVFVTVNVPGGSNNDTDPWYGTPTASAAQLAERDARTGADVRWLDTAFGLARLTRARGVVVLTQADMWDVDGKSAAHLTQYEPIVASLAGNTARFGGPVLLFTGDSHTYRSDDPLQQGAPCTGDAGVCSSDAWQSHPSYDVPNFHRIVVHGSTVPLEWLKLTVTPLTTHPTTDTSFGPFSWIREPQA